MIDLAAIKARLAAASPGPWRESGAVPRAIVAMSAPERNLLGDYTFADGETYAVVSEPEDADLIAHAPEDLAALVAEVEQLRERVAAAEALELECFAYHVDRRNCCR